MNYNVISNRKFRKNEKILYRDTIYYFIKNNSIQFSYNENLIK